MSKATLLVYSAAIVALLGCSPSSTEVADRAEVTRDHSLDGTTEVPIAFADTTKPDAVVKAFLDALRDGNDEIAEALLTTIARKETQEHELYVQPPGSPSANYEIGEVKHVQGGVHVNSSWSEFAQTGERSVYEIVWVLRHEPIGWRVAGMATAINPSKPPIYLNFEDVPDMLDQWKQADEELTAQAKQQAAAMQANQSTPLLQR